MYVRTNYTRTHVCMFTLFIAKILFTDTQDEGTKSTAINAVAFQDHLMQRLSLNSGSYAKSYRCARNSSTVNASTPGGIILYMLTCTNLINLRKK